MNKVRWQHALCYTIERALTTYDWLKEQQAEYESSLAKNVSAAEAAARVRVLCDAFSVYITTLVSGGGSRSYSLSGEAPDIYEKVKSLEVVKKCKDNRHHRSAHEADTYGHFIGADDILSSDIRSILEAVRAAICIR